MSVINSIPLIAAGDDGYQISRSMRLRSSASAYFSRATASTGNQRTLTLSAWVKRGALGASLFTLFGNGAGSVDYIGFNSDSLRVSFAGGTSAVQTTAVYRDTSAWYHIVVAIDTTQATASNRVLVWVNGVAVTAFSTASYPAQNAATSYNTSGTGMLVGQVASGNYFDGYLTEVNFIDGQALTPSSFGETDTLTGVWKPKKYAGTYGTNGFYLNFSDNSNNTAATIGKDWSGNGNNWTPNNISVTSGVTYDSMLDVPTMWADGGNGRGNYCVLSPVDINGGTVSDGNLKFTGAGRARATVAMPFSGLWYFEASSQGTSAGIDFIFGLINSATPITGVIHSNGCNFYISDTRYFELNGVQQFTKAGSVASTDTMQIAYDAGSGKVWLGINNTWYDSAGNATGNPSAGTGQFATLSTSVNWSVYTGVITGAQSSYANFGQRPFAYTPPTGFKALNTQNLPEATIKKGGSYFNTVLYTGNAGSQSITGVGFQPDLVWGKLRSTSGYHRLHDVLRGADNTLSTNVTDAEVSGNGLVSFDADGFTMDSGTNINQAYTYVAWNWKESVSAGFDIVTYTGNGTSARAISHSLGVAPKMVIAKLRSGAGENWNCWHTSLGGNSYRILLNTTGAVDTGSPTVWGTGGINPTSTTFQVGSATATNGNGSTYVAYLFAEVAGYSKFGSYTGNGSTDGPFVYCGFRPRYVLIKNTTTAGTNWLTWDSSTSSYNASNNYLLPNSSVAEQTSGADIDILSNGFKVRNSSGSGNTSSATIIYAAFAENPFRNSLAR